MSASCNVCQGQLGAPIFESGVAHTLTTMNTAVQGTTTIYFCDACQHVQSSELPDLAHYYSTEYEINVGSDEEDQLYDVIDGREIYRSQHQASVLMTKIDLTRHCKVLDYGCAKAPSLRAVCEQIADVEPYLYDVTDKYESFWEKFPTQARWAVGQPDPDWAGKMNAVLSFYALEHIPHVSKIVGEIATLLVEGGYFYFVVPDMYQNALDFLVADHVNHFSPQSLWRLMADNGFTDIEIDDHSHASAYIVSAKRSGVDSEAPAKVPFPDRKAEAKALATFWMSIKTTVTEFESSIPADIPLVIYGAGGYGNFIFSCLAAPERVTHFLDQNVHLQGTKVAGVPIIAPQDLPHDEAAILVGLNPQHAHRIISEIPGFISPGRDFLYL